MQVKAVIVHDLMNIVSVRAVASASGVIVVMRKGDTAMQPGRSEKTSLLGTTTGIANGSRLLINTFS